MNSKTSDRTEMNVLTEAKIKHYASSEEDSSQLLLGRTGVGHVLMAEVST